MKIKYFNIYVEGVYYDSVYDEQDIIKLSCELVNGQGIDPEKIKVVEIKKEL